MLDGVTEFTKSNLILTNSFFSHLFSLISTCLIDPSASFSLVCIQPPVFLKVYLFAVREKVQVSGVGAKGERIPSRFHAINTEPDMGLDLMAHEIMI